MKHSLKPLAACMAALFGTTSFNVLAAPPAAPPVQNQTQNPAGPQTRTDVPNAAVVSPPLFPLPTTSAFPAQPKEFPGIPWGSFLVFPEVSLAATYDDNIYAERPYVPTRSSLAHDVIYTLSPSIALKSKWTQHELNFDAGGDFDRYRTHDSEDVNDYWLGFDGRYDISPNTNIFGGARHSHDHEDRSTAGARDPAYQTEPTLYDHEEAHLGVAHSFGAYRLRMGGTYDRYNYKDSTSFLGTPIDDHVANLATAQLLFLAAEDPEKDISLYINSPGGSITAGMAIYDTMQFVRPDVVTICIGQAASIAAVLLAAGAPKKRFCLPNARVLIHQPWISQVSGQATDIDITAKEILRMRAVLAQILSKHTGQPIEKIDRDTERDFIMTAEQAKEYGIVDEIIVKHP